ncbi:hypothetical protein SDC9_195099 [bioreactor metagenome]|uniref:Uncharacterized protein n=1 Tax=bioreactor metagenome TaxID=1076179 RepID=A0A645I817_9ZZZZ
MVPVASRGKLSTKELPVPRELSTDGPVQNQSSIAIQDFYFGTRIIFQTLNIPLVIDAVIIGSKSIIDFENSEISLGHGTYFTA